jgi:methylthioribose-1-phosphate isomerase
MQVKNQHYQTIWPDASNRCVHIIDQTRLPFAFETVRIENLAQMVNAIKTMQVRGAPLIGVAAAYGIVLAIQEMTLQEMMLQKDLSDDRHAKTAYTKAVAEQDLSLFAHQLLMSRPTAVNLAWAVNRMQAHLQSCPLQDWLTAAWQEAAKIAEEDVIQNKAIGVHGLALIKRMTAEPRKQKEFNILTHCNAGWLATVDVGTALAPIYAAFDAGLVVHVWVDETRPRNQGASLTAWELGAHGVPHTVITDNAGGHLMQQGLVDMVIVGADRVNANGDVCNKIGTYLKALAAFDNQIPFYAAVPSPTIDWTIQNGLLEIEIEQRACDEVTNMQGLAQDGSIQTLRIMPFDSSAANPAFDVTPARLVTGIITERGIYMPNQLMQLEAEISK